ncbi:MAG: hypothetical protein ABSG15_05620, partial [FCB group bacterium]|jgi:hypothetical protein
MKFYAKYIFLLLFLCSTWAVESYSQTIDTLAIAQIYNQALISPDTLTFDLKLIRTSDKWDHFANATFQIKYIDTTQVDSTKINILFIPNSSDLKIFVPTGNSLPVTEYLVTPRVFKGRISITIAGPEAYTSAISVMRDSAIKIGSFVIATNDGSMLPKGLDWIQPYYYYQACAYKVPQDTFFIPGALMYQKDDNVEMNDSTANVVKYVTERNPEPHMDLKYFHADYAGLKKVSLTWATESEAYNKGFILKRAEKPYNIPDTTKWQWFEFARWNGGKPLEAGMKGAGTTWTPHNYGYNYDTVKYRGIEYCYELLYQDFDNNEIHLAYACLQIPNAVIVAATPYPNPFASSTIIKYRVDDDVYMTTTVYDLKGKQVKKLYDNDYIKYGEHEITFNASDFASQGLYDVIFLAYPVDDPSVEISRAIVKIQLIR